MNGICGALAIDAVMRSAKYGCDPPLSISRGARINTMTDGTFITGSDFLMDGGVTTSYWFGELAPA
jgi:hypothetical protein